jgi:beta-mannosidase
MINQRLLVVIIAMISFCGCKNDKLAVSEIGLNDNWSFQKVGDTVWLDTKVPGSVHIDLLNNKKIKDPFYRLNEHELQWIDKEDWQYKTNFELSENELSMQNIELEFFGLDTYSKVFLNDSLVLQTDNMFRNYIIDCKHLLKKGENKLQVLFESPIKKGIKKHDEIGYAFPKNGNDLAEIGKVEDAKKVSIFTRKAGYHFGWDWGPRLVTSGVWRPVKLRSWNHHKIEDLFIKQNHLDSVASLTAMIELDVKAAAKEAKVEVLLNKKSIKIVDVELMNGKNTLKIPFEIANPELWWPNGMGNQVLYDVEVKINSNSYTDSKSHRVGLRTIELITEADSLGSAFYFKVNGHAVFMKGANYIPQDPFLSRVKKSNYEFILNSAKEANMNMIRVWGGGIYENDAFYDLCDEKGLLVWQDFMFACAMYPGDESFLQNVKQEAIDNVKRLRNHTSIALWCGNNENQWAWQNWGWKEGVAKEQSQEVVDVMWKSYDDLFHKILPEVINQYDSDRAFWSSSPSSSRGEKISFTKGDYHYWGVWWGKKPFENYNTAIPRFMSEFGFQSFPEFSSIKKYTNPEDYDVYSEVMKSHQRSSIGNVTIEEYMLRDYKKPKDFQSFLYVSQLLQANGVNIGFEAHRRNKDVCMGSLYWQLNDCWPVASWSSIDYFGKWKALHYKAKKSFRNFLVSYKNNEESVNVFVVSDSISNTNAQLNVRLIDFEGNELKQWNENVTITANSSESHLELMKNDFLNDTISNKVLLYAELVSNKKVLSENIMYFVPNKEQALTKPKITYSILENENQFTVELETDRLAKNVFLSTNSTHNFSDNYFDMLPNSKKNISIKKGQSEDLESFKNSLKIITLVDSYNK